MTGTLPPPQHPDLPESTPLDGVPGGHDAEPEQEAGRGLPEGYEPVLAAVIAGHLAPSPAWVAREEGNAS